MTHPLIVVSPHHDVAALCQQAFARDLTGFSDMTAALTRIRSFPATTLIYDSRNQPESHTESDLLMLHQEPGLRPRIVIVTEGAMPLSIARLAVRYADEEWDLRAGALPEPRWMCPLPGSDRKTPFRIATPAGWIETCSVAYRNALEIVSSVSDRAVPVLLSGETGTGKTTTARLLHQWSPQADAPFAVLACGAVPFELLDSELFGHVRGAFTSANTARVGRLEAAGEGTLLLDEIDLLGCEQQAKLLRVIETGAFEPVGAVETRQARCRLVFASNVDLQQRVDEGTFRSDLYYRINIVDVQLPSLRDRVDDIGLLAVSCLHEAAQQMRLPNCRVSLSFLRQLQEFDWPGNIRELKNRLTRALALSADGHVSLADLGKTRKLPAETPSGQEAGGWLSAELRHIERRAIEQALAQHRYNRAAAARALGISRATLYKKLDRLAIKPPLPVRQPLSGHEPVAAAQRRLHDASRSESSVEGR